VLSKANTENRHKKNEIFVETVAGTVVGAASTFGLTILLASNPVGWVVAIGLGAGAAYGSYKAGRKAASLYNEYGREIDLVSMSGVDKFCR
jgi:F0F1-type ATP synthase assembly protein I